jgi:hypothetical protein
MGDYFSLRIWLGFISDVRSSSHSFMLFGRRLLQTKGNIGHLKESAVAWWPAGSILPRTFSFWAFEAVAGRYPNTLWRIIGFAAFGFLRHTQSLTKLYRVKSYPHANVFKHQRYPNHGSHGKQKQ